LAVKQVVPFCVILCCLGFLFLAVSAIYGIESPPTRHHFIFLDQEFILTLELVRPGIPIFNFINLGNGTFQLPAADIRIVAGIKLFRPELFDVETSNRKDPLRIGAMKVRPHSSFGVTLKGNLEGVTEIDRVTVELGPNRFELQSISLPEFESLSRKIAQLNLISPDIREDFRVLELKSLGTRKQIPR
jgi:hypothetical protein